MTSMMIGRRTFIGLCGSAMTLPIWAQSPVATQPAGSIVLLPPTGQKVLDGSMRQNVFMDTGTGRPESGMFGNTRKYANGAPRFHEGIDIAPVQPWRRNTLPTDVVHAIAEGTVVYVNTYKYNASLYGNYVVLMHDIAGFGQLYTLYGHLSRFAQGLRAGLRVKAGSPLGVMGNIPDIPVGRAHLHFEIGICMSRNYPMIDPQHGIWNGANLYGFNPCDAYAWQAKHGAFDVSSYLLSRKVAFYVNVPIRNAKGKLAWSCSHNDYLGAEHVAARSAAALVGFSCEGIPLMCTPAKPAEVGDVILKDAAELKKGRAFVKRDARGRATLTARGETLIENLLVSPSFPPKSAEAMGEVG